MKYKIICLLNLLVLITLGCTNNNRFYREKELLNLVHIYNDRYSSQNYIVLLLVGSSCESCLSSTKEILNHISNKNVKNLVVILGDETAFIEYSSTAPKEVPKIITCNDSLLSKGLLFPSEMIFFINKNNNISKHIEITKSSKSEIIRNLKKKKYI